MSIALASTATTLDPAADNGRHADGRPGAEEMLAGSRLQGVFLISECLMIMLVSIIFAAAEGGVIPMLAGAMAPFALYAVDRQRWLSMPNFWAGFLGIVALLTAFIEFASGDIEARLLAGGHFMCYLSWIVLWQKKEWREHWTLAALCILQVAVGALLTNSHWLGAGLFAYIVVALWTLCVFTMYRMEAVSAESQARRLRPLKFDVWFPVDAMPAHRALMATCDRPLGVSGRFIGISLAVIGASLLFSVVAFLLVPRVWVGQFQIFDNSPLPGTRPMTGFTSEVRLGDLGQILESSEPVMDIEFYDNVTGRKLSLSDAFSQLGDPQPLFRGGVLEVYTAGRWRASGGESGQRSMRPAGRDFLRQEIKLYPVGTNTVFTAGNPQECIAREPVESIYKDPTDLTFFRSATANLRANLMYFVLTHPNEPVESHPPFARWSQRGSGENPPGSVPVTLRIPDGLQEVVASTRERLEQAEGLETELDQALFLEDWLRNSGEFSYTLSLSVSDPNVDPIHDFFFNRKSGHCEYFASTLTIMLRAAGIHARMVSGFKGGESDTATETLKVQQLHAHAWVEAWIDNHWVQLDATPSTRLESVASIQSGHGWKRWLNRLQSVWNDGLTWSKEDQDELIYNPVRDSLTATWNTLKSPTEGLRNLVQSIRAFLSDPTRWFSWQGGLAVLIISLVVVGFWKFIRFLINLIGRRRQLASLRDAGGISVAFYARFESLLKRLQLARAPAQTPREFASEVRGRFETMPDASLWPTEFPSQIADCFYSVRFGGQDLEPAIASRIDDELNQLEERLRRADAKNGQPA